MPDIEDQDQDEGMPLLLPDAQRAAAIIGFAEELVEEEYCKGMASFIVSLSASFTASAVASSCGRSDQAGYAVGFTAGSISSLCYGGDRAANIGHFVGSLLGTVAGTSMGSRTR